MKRAAGFVLIAFLLSGCATPYKKVGFMGGYSELQLGENIFQVSFRGNGYTRPQRAADLCLLRSAEIALENGYHYFAIIEKIDTSKRSTYTTPTTSKTTGSAYISGNSVSGSATTTTHGGQTYNISKPRSNNTILCFKEKPDTIGLYFEAEFIIKSIKSSYKIK